MTIFAASFPDALEMVKNISGIFEFAFSFLRYFLMAMAVMYMAFSILNLHSITTSSTGQINKMFPSRAQPTLTSAWAQVLLAGLIMVTAITLLPIASSMSALTGEATINYYSIGSYDQNTDSLQTATSQLVNRAFAFLGLLAFFRGFVTAWKITNGETDHKFGRVVGYFFFGLLCFNIEFTNAVISNTIGFDTFGFLFDNN